MSASTSSTTKMVTLKSSDGITFEVAEVVAMLSQTIGYMIEDGCADNVIPLPNVTANILSKVIDYCKKHADVGCHGRDAAVKAWDDEFIEVDLDTLYDLIMAANYLEIEGLLELTCQKVADLIKGKSPEEIRKMFNIKYDFTPEQEEEIRRDKSTTIPPRRTVPYRSRAYKRTWTYI